MSPLLFVTGGAVGISSVKQEVHGVVPFTNWLMVSSSGVMVASVPLKPGSGVVVSPSPEVRVVMAAVVIASGTVGSSVASSSSSEDSSEEEELSEDLEPSDILCKSSLWTRASCSREWSLSGMSASWYRRCYW